MNFLEYFGVDTTKYECLELITDFELNTSNSKTSCTLYNGIIIYFYDLIIDNLNKDNIYCSNLYTLLIKDSSVCRKYITAISGTYKIGYSEEDIRTTYNSFAFTSSDIIYDSIYLQRIRIVKVLITKNSIFLYHDTSHYINNFNTLTIDTRNTQSEVSKIEQKFKEEQESNNMNFLEYFGVDITKYSSLYFTADFNIRARNLVMYNHNAKFDYDLEVYLKSNNSTFVRMLAKFLTNNSNQYLKEITLLLSNNNKILESYGYRITHTNLLSCGGTYISNNYTYDKLRYGCDIRKDIEPRNIKRVKITESYIDLYFDDSKFRYDDNMLEVEGPQVPTNSNKENKDSMNMLQIETKVLDTNISSKNNRTYPSIILDSLPCSGRITVSTFDIEEIKFRDKGGTTIVFWKDGTKTILKRQKGEKNDIEKVVAMAYMKKALSMMPTAKQRDMNSIITHAKVKYWQDVAEAKKIEEEKAKKAAKKKQKQEEAKLKEESKKKPTHRSSKK